MVGLTYTNILTKLKAQASTADAGVVTQLVEDYNTGYQRLRSKLNRYWVRKQQFASLVAGQQYYQLAVDVKAIEAVSVQVSTNHELPLRRVASEADWRALTSQVGTSTRPTHYFPTGNRAIGLWPTPASAVSLGLRVVYQPRPFSLSVADITSTGVGATAIVVNGSRTVTLSGAVLSGDKTGLSFQVTGILDDTIYSIVASTASTLTLEAPYVAASAAGLAWRVGQTPDLPEEYHFTPGHEALAMRWEAAGNSERSAFHLKRSKDQEQEALASYSSAGSSSIITEETPSPNPWLQSPRAG